MSSITKTSIIAAAAFALCGVGTAMATPFTGPTTVIFDQGFETDTSGWFEADAAVTRTASGGGTLGVASAAGSYHAEVAIGTGYQDGAFTRFGGYSSTWPGFIRQSLDIFIDPNAGSVGDGWFLDNAVNSTGGSWLEAGGVGAQKTASGVWSVAADADGGGYPGGGLAIDTAGWYRIVSEWVDNGNLKGGTDPAIDRNTYIYNAGGTLLYSNENLAQTSLTGLGGWRYGWLAQSNDPGSAMTLAIDNSVLEVAGVPEPATLGLVGLGLAGIAFARRRRR